MEDKDSDDDSNSMEEDDFDVDDQRLAKLQASGEAKPTMSLRTSTLEFAVSFAYHDVDADVVVVLYAHAATGVEFRDGRWVKLTPGAEVFAQCLHDSALAVTDCAVVSLSRRMTLLSMILDPRRPAHRYVTHLLASTVTFGLTTTLILPFRMPSAWLH